MAKPRIVEIQLWPPNWRTVALVVPAAGSVIGLWIGYIAPLITELRDNSRAVVFLERRIEHLVQQSGRQQQNMSAISVATSVVERNLARMAVRLTNLEKDELLTLKHQQVDTKDSLQLILDWIVGARRQLNRLEHQVTNVYVKIFDAPRAQPNGDEAPPPSVVLPPPPNPSSVVQSP